MTKVLVTGTSVRHELLQPLLEAGYTVFNPTHVLTEDELAAELSDTSAYLFGGDEYASEKALANAQKLRVIAFLGVGYESFMDVKAANRLHIPITNTPGTLSNSVAEFTVGLLLTSTRRLNQYAGEYVAGIRGKEEKQHDLKALRIGILGLGAIGSRIAQILVNGFECNVSYYSRSRKPELENTLSLEYMALEQLGKTSDVLIVMTPGNADTKDMLGAKFFSNCKPGLILINTARPDIVNEQALLSALNSGAVSYAAFDGFYENSANLESLKSMIPDRLTITGHIASLTHEARDGMANKAVNSIINMIEIGVDEYVVNPQN